MKDLKDVVRRGRVLLYSGIMYRIEKYFISYCRINTTLHCN